jgi:MFS family permease
MTAALEGRAGSLVLRALLPLGAGFFLSNFLRAANAVLSPYLIADLGLTAGALGLLTSVHFFASALSQLPLGLALDRFGPRLVQGSMMIVTAAGVVLFALGNDVGELVIGRAIMGIGAAGALMTCFQAVVLWSPPLRWPTLNGWIMAAGGLGAFAASVPAALLLHVLSWRGLLLLAAALTLAVAIGVLAIVPEARTTRPRDDLRTQLAGFVTIMRSRLFWRMAPIMAAVSGTNLAFAGLWAGPWLKDVGGLGPDGIALSLVLLTGLSMLGYVGIGAVAAWLGRRGIGLNQVIAGGMLCSIVLQLPLLAPTVAGRWIVMCGIGGFGGASVLSYAVLNRHFPPCLSGRVSTALNLFFFIGAFVVQYSIGTIIDFFPQIAPGTYPAAAYQTAFAAMIVFQLLSWLWFLIPVKLPPA